MDNRSAFSAVSYDDNVRKVIPYYDEIYKQIVGVIKAYFGEKELSFLDTGCGTGAFGETALKELHPLELVLCDPSEKMLADAKKKLAASRCEFVLTGSEELAFESRFDVVTAIQSHHYFDRETREKAVKNCFRALKPGGMFICFENTAPFSELGRGIMLRRLEEFERAAGRTPEQITAHSARYGKEFFPITVKEHLELLGRVGFKSAELLWHSYMQSGFYAVK